jgi:lycopene beta-cyclase
MTNDELSMKKYDFIVAGGGMAGLSLLHYLSQTPLRDRSILLIDKAVKNQNDRTWSFWERGAGPFEEILFRSWQTVDFFGTTFSGPLQLGDYQYKMLRGIDFYDFTRKSLARLPNLEIRQATIDRIKETPQGGFVIADGEPLLADVVFDSTYAMKQNLPQHHNLLQHFKGWVITAERPCFDPARPRIMDYRVNQHGDCRFLYVLPFDEHTAFVEFTLFNQKLLTEAEYETDLRQYIASYLDTGSYTISATEFGIIPMTDEPAPEHPMPHIVRIGTSGGYTKASTGYTFLRTQRYLQELVQSLAETGKPVRHKHWLDRRFALYDSILLNVLEKHRHPADDVFTRVFEHNPPARVFRFLDEDSSLLDELRIINSMPKLPFTLALFDVLKRKWLGA